MEIIINSPNFYLHLQDAVLMVQFLIDGHYSSDIKILKYNFFISGLFICNNFRRTYGAVLQMFAFIVLPLDKGVVSGRSYCPKCKKQITWKDNIPIISYFLLNGKCRKCKKPISSQYALVEFLSILFFIIIYFLYGITLTTLLLMVLSLSFIIIFFIDLKHFIIPNEITFSMMVLGFIKSFDPNLNSTLSKLYKFINWRFVRLWNNLVDNLFL